MSSSTETTSPRKEEGIAACVAPHLGRVILLGVKVLPGAGRVDVFVPLVPAPIDDLSQPWVVVGSLEGAHVGESFGCGGLGLGCRQTSSGVDRGEVFRRVSRIAEDALAAWSDAFVDEEVVEIIVLESC